MIPIGLRLWEWLSQHPHGRALAAAASETDGVAVSAALREHFPWLIGLHISQTVPLTSRDLVYACTVDSQGEFHFVISPVDTYDPAEWRLFSVQGYPFKSNFASYEVRQRELTIFASLMEY